MACTGLEFCKLAIVETKQHAQDLYAELEKRLPDFDEPIAINVNGCPNSCARFQTADIGFKGSMVRDDSGEMVEGFQVHLGGHLGVEAAFGRKFRGHKVTKAEPPTTASGCSAATWSTGAGRAVRRLRRPRRRGLAAVSKDKPPEHPAPAAVPLPVLRGRGAHPVRDSSDGWRCAACLRAFTVRLIATGVQE